MSELERAAADLADGRQLDWDRIQSAASPAELAALRLLSDARLVRTDEISGFELLGELGRGSHSSVHRALDVRLGRQVALKVLHPENASPERRAKFLQEARDLASLRHPCVVQIHSVDAHGGELRLVMELIEGHTLHEWVQRDGPLSVAEAARVGAELCRALAALHAIGLVHRDLKPANVMRESGGRIVLLDFGIALSRRGDRVLEAAGTPRFMSPEQFLGKEVGPTSDLWSLGVLLYWLVSQRLPFAGETHAELERNVCAGRATPLIDARPDIDPRFARVLERACALEPAARFPSAGAFEQALHECAARAEPAEPPERTPASLWPARLLLAAALVASSYFAWRALRPDPPALELRLELQAERGQADVALVDGSELQPGDGIFLDVSAPVPFHLYVLNHDALGAMYVLFPGRAWQLRNPLTSEELHRLPGKNRDGQPRTWRTSSESGGSEELYFVASRAPIAELEDLVARLPEVTADDEPTYPRLDPDLRDAVLRGIDGTAPARAASEMPAGTTIASVVQALSPESGAFVRRLRLKSGD